MNGGTISVNKEKDARQIIITLAIILVAQIALSCFLKYNASQYQPFEPSAKLITADLDKVTKIEVQTGGGMNLKPFVIQKDKGTWTIPSYYHAPVNAKTISKFYSMLKGIAKGLPVATTAGARPHFNVGSDDYRQLVTLSSDKGKVVTLYLGNASSMRTTYVRLDGSDDVFNVATTVGMFNPNPQIWFDKSMTSLDTNQVTAVDLGSFKVNEVKNGWILTDKDGEHPISKRTIFDLLDKVTHIDCHSILSDTKLPTFDADHPVFVFKVTLKDGKHVEFSISKATDKPWHVLKVSTMDLYFEVDQWGMKEIQAISAESILKQQAEENKQSKPKS
jgi:hypothetical protein